MGTLCTGRLRKVLLAVAALIVGAGVATVAPASAAAPVGPSWIVTLGDSYISGEAGRWAGNTNGSSSNIDATGSDTYFDNAARTGEQILGCHRSESAEAYTGDVLGLDLACSGAKTSSVLGSDWKPGIDFYGPDSAGRKGQARMLQEFAGANRVGMVVLSIGGNDFSFASIVQSCVTDFLTSPSWWPNYCYDDSSVASKFTSTAVETNTQRITNAILNVQSAMRTAGYADAEWSLLVQTYPSPIPRGSGFRYSQSGYTRQSTGGCGFWNRDADWANDVALARINGAVRTAVTRSAMTNVRVLSLDATMNGRRLCENTVGLLEERGLSSWRSAGAVDVTEWVNQIRTVSTIGSPYYVQESIHPSYWGQLAVRSCVRAAWNGGVPRGGTCVRAGAGLTARGEPVMALQ